MTSRLRIQLRQSLTGSAASAAAVAKVTGLRQSESTPSLEVVIPAGYGHYREVDVDAGEYMVEAVLPSGSMIRQRVVVADGESRDVNLDVRSQHEWLGWQELAGQQARYVPSADLAPKVHTHVMPPAMRAGEWRRLAKLGTSRAAVDHHALVAALGAEPGSLVHPEQDDGAVALYSWTLGRVPPYFDHTIAIVERGPITEMLSLPVPWSVDGAFASFQVAVPRDPTLPLSITIGDPALGGMIGYLGSGSLTSAQTMLRTGAVWSRAENALFGKFRNPFAAAAAACVLAQSEPTATVQHWDPWIRNLAKSFPRLPDGAIVLATRRLAFATQPADLDGVREALHMALKRGVPLFASAARMLVEAMTTLVGDDSSDSGGLEGANGLGAVRTVMLRLQSRQAFSVLRFGRPPRRDR